MSGSGAGKRRSSEGWACIHRSHPEAMSNEQYSSGKRSYASWGVDTEAALEETRIDSRSLCTVGRATTSADSSMRAETLSGGGIQATGNYPGKARTLEELRQDLDKALSLIPGRHRLNLHAMYADFGGGRPVPRNELTTAHFQSWINWCKERGLGLDFNPSFFSHPSG